MDTTKTSNPSSKADEADDLIEELARLMADDAQINTPSAQPAPKPGGFKPRGLSEEGGTASPPAASPPAASPPPAAGVTTPNATPKTPAPNTTGAPDGAGEPSFDLNQFDLGTPKAEISSVAADAETPPSPAQPTPPSQAQSSAQTDPTDFDFGFGIGPVGAEAPQT
ncbi:MAG TPA: hypothetical protein ENK61_01820, partial [Devosia sp.]|nr:hypothetical protein [Devosia sp.]